MSAHVSSFDLYRDLFSKIARTRGLRDIETFVRSDERGEYLTLRAQKDFRAPDEPISIGTAEITIILYSVPKKKNCFAVSTFQVTLRYPAKQHFQIQQGSDLLAYYGKRPWTRKRWNPGPQHWTFERPVDLLALLEAYDRIARRTGCEPLFTP